VIVFAVRFPQTIAQQFTAQSGVDCGGPCKTFSGNLINTPIISPDGTTVQGDVNWGPAAGYIFACIICILLLAYTILLFLFREKEKVAEPAPESPPEK